MSHENNPGSLTFHYKWLINRDPFNGLLQSPYNWVVFHPLLGGSSHLVNG